MTTEHKEKIANAAMGLLERKARPLMAERGWGLADIAERLSKIRKKTVRKQGVEANLKSANPQSRILYEWGQVFGINPSEWLK